MPAMKIAISLPDPLFAAAEELAGQMQVSRSQLYAQALADFLERRNQASVTERLNAVHGVSAEGLEPALAAAQTRVLTREAW